MLRFRLEPADLLAVRFETRPGPLEDVGCASRALRQRRARHLAEWRALVVPRLPPEAAVALMLQPPYGVSFGFTAPLGYLLDDGLQAVQSISRRELRDEVDDVVAHQGGLPAPLRGLGDAEPATLRQVAAGLRAMHRTAIAPIESQLHLIRDAEVALRGQHVARGGLATVINDIHPTLRLRDMALEVDRPWDDTVRSSGRGIVFTPSPWLLDEIRVHHVEDGPLKISYPTRLPLRIDPRPGRSLGRLLGGTRARLLAALSTETGPGPGTSALAAELGISAPTASEHLSVLREARLITTHRGPNGATHNLTSAGHHLLSLNFQ